MSWPLLSVFDMRNCSLHLRVSSPRGETPFRSAPSVAPTHFPSQMRLPSFEKKKKEGIFSWKMITGRRCSALWAALGAVNHHFAHSISAGLKDSPETWTKMNVRYLYFSRKREILMGEAMLERERDGWIWFFLSLLTGMTDWFIKQKALSGGWASAPALSQHFNSLLHPNTSFLQINLMDVFTLQTWTQGFGLKSPSLFHIYIAVNVIIVSWWKSKIQNHLRLGPKAIGSSKFHGNAFIR